MLLILAASSLFALVQAGAPPAVPPPAEQATADCTNPVYASDQLVCSDSELKARDAELAALVGEAPVAGAVLMESDSAWFKRSRRCAFAADHRACLVAAYDERIALHQALSAPPAPEDKTFVRPCMIEGQLREIRFYGSLSSGPIVLSDSTSGAVLGVLLPFVTAEAPWKPYAALTLTPRRFGIRIVDGTDWRCRR